MLSVFFNNNNCKQPVKWKNTIQATSCLIRNQTSPAASFMQYMYFYASYCASERRNAIYVNVSIQQTILEYLELALVLELCSRNQRNPTVPMTEAGKG